jgi:hypothetical protein
LDLEDIFLELEGGSTELLSVLSNREIEYFLEVFNNNKPEDNE